jgi:hypothetical protein
MPGGGGGGARGGRPDGGGAAGGGRGKFPFGAKSGGVGASVKSLKGKKFPGAKAKSAWMVLFCSVRAGSCAALAPTWGKLGKRAKQGVLYRVGAVDCDAERRLCARQADWEEQGGNDGAPVVRLVVHGSSHDLQEWREDDSGAAAAEKAGAGGAGGANGLPSVKLLHAFASSKLADLPPPPVVFALRTRAHADAFRAEQCGGGAARWKRCAVLFTERSEPSAGTNALGLFFRHDLPLAEVRAARSRNVALARLFGVYAFPTLLVLDENGDEVDRYVDEQTQTPQQQQSGSGEGAVGGGGGKRGGGAAKLKKLHGFLLGQKGQKKRRRALPFPRGLPALTPASATELCDLKGVGGKGGGKGKGGSSSSSSGGGGSSTCAIFLFGGDALRREHAAASEGLFRHFLGDARVSLSWMFSSDALLASLAEATGAAGVRGSVADFSRGSGGGGGGGGGGARKKTSKKKTDEEEEAPTPAPRTSSAEAGGAAALLRASHGLLLLRRSKNGAVRVALHAAEQPFDAAALASTVDRLLGGDLQMSPWKTPSLAFGAAYGM